MLVVIGICVQIKTIEEATDKVGGSGLRDSSGLKDQLVGLQGEYQSLYKELENREDKLEEVRQNASNRNEADSKNEAEIKNNKILLGQTEVSGPGLIIRLKEDTEVNTDEVIDISKYLVHEEDLLYIVNELFNCGADAISINDQRIISTSSILCDGNIIRVNGEMVGVPITIKAIGSPEGMSGALLRPGGYLQLMANEGIIASTEKSENITIPKYEGIYSYEYLTRGDE